ncbi:hypothetical protein, partial [Escherichia coli]|uniref:hypothetical protein n=1 Tax=Escherichia coli TaxID=562 RepID=UPI003D1B286C
MIWQPEFTNKTLSRKPGAVHLAACPLLLDKITTKHRVKQVVTASLKLRDYDGQCADFHGLPGVDIRPDTGAGVLRIMNRPGFPGECFICELRLPDH